MARPVTPREIIESETFKRMVEESNARVVERFERVNAFIQALAKSKPGKAKR